MLQTATVDVHIGDGGVTNRYGDNIDGAATGLTALYAYWL